MEYVIVKENVICNHLKKLSRGAYSGDQEPGKISSKGASLV